MSIIVSRIPAFVAVYVSRAFSGSPMGLRTPEQIAAYLSRIVTKGDFKALLPSAAQPLSKHPRRHPALD
jgi:hypothetical protein